MILYESKNHIWNFILVPTKRGLFKSYFYLFFQKFYQILKFHERVISALKFELSGKRSQILVVNSCEWVKV